MAGERFLFSKLDLFLEGALDSEIKSVIRKKALWGIAALIPGVGVFILVIALWSMYKEIAAICTVPFRENLLKNIGGAIVINFIVFGIIMALSFIPGFDILNVFIGPIQLYLSGMLYVKGLQTIYGDGRVRRTLDIQGGINKLKNNRDVNETKTSKKISHTDSIKSSLQSGELENAYKEYQQYMNGTH